MAEKEQEVGENWPDSTYVSILGVHIAKFVADPNLEENLRHPKTRKDDVFVVSYPKSGTTWVRELLWQIYNDGVLSNVHLGSRVFFFESLPLVYRPEMDQSNTKPVVELLPSPRLFVSHLPYHVIPKGRDEASECKYIYIARNPKDVAFSYFRFMQQFNQGKDPHEQVPLDKFLDMFLEGKFAYNLWLDHVLGWWAHREDKNVLFLKYEDLHKDVLTQIRAMAKFVNKPLSEDVIKRIAHQCSFMEMRKNPASFQVFPGVNEISFLRSGNVGDWTHHFTPEMSEKYERKFISKIREKGLEF